MTQLRSVMDQDGRVYEVGKRPRGYAKRVRVREIRLEGVFVEVFYSWCARIVPTVLHATDCTDVRIVGARR